MRALNTIWTMALKKTTSPTGIAWTNFTEIFMIPKDMLASNISITPFGIFMAAKVGLLLLRFSVKSKFSFAKIRKYNP